VFCEWDHILAMRPSLCFQTPRPKYASAFST